MDLPEIKRKYEQDLNRVKDAIVAASEHFNIHYILTNANDRPKYVDVLNQYLGFFGTSISAHFTSVLLTLSKALDENIKNNVMSMYSLVQTAQKYNLIKASNLQEIKNELKTTRESYRKLLLLRNNQFAHLGNLDSEDAFRRAQISPNELKSLIDTSIKILRKIYYSYDRGDFHVDYDSKKDTYSLLNNLLKLYKS